MIIRLKTNLLKAKHLMQFTSLVRDHIISQVFQWISVYCKVRKSVLRSWDMGRTLKHISDHLCLLASLNVNMLSRRRQDLCTRGPVMAGSVLQLVNWSPAAGSLDFFKVNQRHGHPERADQTSVRLSGHETLMRTKVLHISYTPSLPSPTRHTHTHTQFDTPDDHQPKQTRELFLSCTRLGVKLIDDFRQLIDRKRHVPFFVCWPALTNDVWGGGNGHNWE